MEPLDVKVSYAGGSACIYIPKTVLGLFKLAPGMTVSMQLVEGAPMIERSITAGNGGRTSLIFLPQEYLEICGVKRGDTVAVPFHNWVPMKRSPADKVARAKARVPR